MDKGLVPAGLPAEQPLHSPWLPCQGSRVCGQSDPETGSQCCGRPPGLQGAQASLTPLPTQTAALLGIPARPPREAGRNNQISLSGSSCFLA